MAELPGLTVTGDEGERGTVERDFIKKNNFQKCNKTAEMLAACQWDTVLLVC